MYRSCNTQYVSAHFRGNKYNDKAEKTDGGLSSIDKNIVAFRNVNDNNAYSHDVLDIKYLYNIKH